MGWKGRYGTFFQNNMYSWNFNSLNSVVWEVELLSLTTEVILKCHNLWVNLGCPHLPNAILGFLRLKESQVMDCVCLRLLNEHWLNTRGWQSHWLWISPGGNLYPLQAGVAPFMPRVMWLREHCTWVSTSFQGCLQSSPASRQLWVLLFHP